MNKYMKQNLKLWNELTAIHKHSASYDLKGFKSGKSTLKSIELEEMGDVKGKSILHLQCHFGLDTLCWARMGAAVTGVDFSDKAIALAKSLSQELKIDANFICTDTYELPKILKGQFDFIFTSYGVLCWLPNLKDWGSVIAHFLKPKGIFYIVELHPFGYIFDDDRDATSLKVRCSYFHSPQPKKWEPDGSYADRKAKVTHPSYEWTHTMSDIINAIISCGLKIEFIHEFPYSVVSTFPFMEKGEDGWWRLKGKARTIPLMFSLKATK